MSVKSKSAGRKCVIGSNDSGHRLFLTTESFRTVGAPSSSVDTGSGDVTAGTPATPVPVTAGTPATPVPVTAGTAPESNDGWTVPSLPFGFGSGESSNVRSTVSTSFARRGVALDDALGDFSVSGTRAENPSPASFGRDECA